MEQLKNRHICWMVSTPRLVSPCARPCFSGFTGATSVTVALSSSATHTRFSVSHVLFMQHVHFMHAPYSDMLQQQVLPPMHIAW